MKIRYIKPYWVLSLFLTLFLMACAGSLSRYMYESSIPESLGKHTLVVAEIDSLDFEELKKVDLYEEPTLHQDGTIEYQTLSPNPSARSEEKRQKYLRKWIDHENEDIVESNAKIVKLFSKYKGDYKIMPWDSALNNTDANTYRFVLTRFPYVRTYTSTYQNATGSLKYSENAYYTYKYYIYDRLERKWMHSIGLYSQTSKWMPMRAIIKKLNRSL